MQNKNDRPAPTPDGPCKHPQYANTGAVCPFIIAQTIFE